MEGDLILGNGTSSARAFQSTPSVWRETGNSEPQRLDRYISIHSLRMEGDPAHYIKVYYRTRFQSTPSVWRETLIVGSEIREQQISIHSLRMEGDQLQTTQEDAEKAISIHSLRMEGDVFRVDG